MGPQSGFRKGATMRWAALFLTFGIGALGQALDAEAKAVAKTPSRRASKAVSLDAFTRLALSDGRQGRIPAPIAGLLGVPDDVPTWGVKVSSDQAGDRRLHIFEVMVEDSGESEVAFGLVLFQDYRWADQGEGHCLRVSLDGRIEKAVLIAGPHDAEGKAIRGAGAATQKDVASAEMKELFQHELDLWLRRAHLRREWRSAEFSDGALRKRSAPPPR